jgi:hypothetical protein
MLEPDTTVSQDRLHEILWNAFVLQKYWEKPEQKESNKNVHFREMFNGFPSYLITIISKECRGKTNNQC